MAKRKNKNRKGKPFTIPVALVAGCTAPFVMSSATGPSILQSVIDGDFEQAGQSFYERFTGINPNGVFNLTNLINNYKPIIAGIGIHYAASKLGVNKRIAAAGIPLFRI